MGANSTVHARFQEWERAGFFEELWQAGVAEYDEMEGIEWEWQAVDGLMSKAPLGAAATGPTTTYATTYGRGSTGIRGDLTMATPSAKPGNRGRSGPNGDLRNR